MAQPTEKNHLFYGDNLEVLRRKIADNSVDLCYIDPPFNSKRNYFQIYNNQGSEDRALARAFIDTWVWGDEAKDGIAWVKDVDQLNSGKLTPQTVSLIKGLEEVLGQGSLLAYVVHMTLRIVEIHRVLKPTGSFYLHCDPTAAHYLKLVLDAVFCGQGGLFQNEIIWKRTGSHSPRRSFGPVHDTIFYYTKALEGFTFNVVRRPYMNGHVQSRYTMQPDGRYKFTSGGNVLTGAGWTAGASGAKWRRFDPRPKDRHWAIPGFYEEFMPPEYLELDSIGKLDALYEAGLVEDDGTSAWPIMVRYLTERDGAAVADIWAHQPYTEGTVFGTKEAIDADVMPLGPTDPERLGYFLVQKGVNGKAIFQVKSGGANRATLATLNSDRLREKAEFGILISMDPPTKPMRDEINAAGTYKHPIINREDNRLMVVTVEEILQGKRLDLPMARVDSLKSAEADDGQGSLL